MANEKRLIDANATLQKIQLERNNYSQTSELTFAGLTIAKKIIEESPTVDAVEVVRCKDCVNYCGFEHCKNGICDVDSVSKRAVYPDDFCSYGERRTDG